MTGCTSLCNQGRDCTCAVQHCDYAIESGIVYNQYGDGDPLPTWETLATYSVLIAFMTLFITLLAAAGSFVIYHLN